MSTIITGLGTALPGSAIPTSTCVAHAKKFSCSSPKQERVLEELYRRTTINTRASVLTDYLSEDATAHMFTAPVQDNDLGPGTEERMNYYSTCAGALARLASQRALSNAKATAESISHLVTVSCTGFYSPGFDIELIDRLGLARDTQRTHVGFMGCHGALNGLRVASALAQAEGTASVLLCAVELCSLHFQYGWSTDKLVANSLFADGAAAVIVKRDHLSADAARFTLKASGSFIVPDSTEAMQWRVGNNGFNMHLSTKVPDIVKACLPGWLPAWLRQHDLSLSEVSAWAVHPGGPRILEAVEQCLALPEEALDSSRAVLAEFGNMSSPTVLFIVERLLSKNISGPCVVLAFGPGLAIEASLLLL